MTYELNDIPSYSEFQYWFRRVGDRTWEVVDRVSDELLSKIHEDGDMGPYKLDFDTFKLRPEYYVGSKISFNSDLVKVEDLEESYCRLLAGSLLIRCRREHFSSNAGVSPDSSFNLDDASKKFVSIYKWLKSTDFFSAPASTQYHESYVGGLVAHSLNVYSQALDLLKLEKFKTIDLDSATITALCHDWCKIGLYEQYDRNVKNPETGKWDKQKAFKCNQTGIPLGHGCSSMFIASRFIKLTTEEALAIRWHMGAWRVVDSEMNELQLANEKCPLVHLIQFADQLSIVQY